MTGIALGPETVAAVVAAALEARMPTVLADLAAGPLGTLDGLEVPALYATSDRYRLEPEAYPAVLVVPQNAGTFLPVDDVDDGGEEYRVRYLVRSFMFARGESYEQVAGYRNRLILAGRLALFRRRQLTADVSHVAPGPGVTYRESLSEAVRDRDRRSVAGGYIEHQVDVFEGTSVAPLGTASTIRVDLQPLE